MIYKSKKLLFNNKKVVSFFYFLHKFTYASIICFFIDVLIFTSLRSNIGTNKSLIISFFISQSILFILLRFTLIKKFKKDINGYLVQIFIGIGSLFIHFCVLTFIDYFILKIYPVFYEEIYLDSKLISFTLKSVCGFFGFFWSSIASKKFLYNSRYDKNL